MVHLQIVCETMTYADQSYQCLDDFASSIKSDEEPECGYENAMLSGRTIYVNGPLVRHEVA
jgi:hypothetical protein